MGKSYTHSKEYSTITHNDTNDLLYFASTKKKKRKLSLPLDNLKNIISGTSSNSGSDSDNEFILSPRKSPKKSPKSPRSPRNFINLLSRKREISEHPFKELISVMEKKGKYIDNSIPKSEEKDIEMLLLVHHKNLRNLMWISPISERDKFNEKLPFYLDEDENIFISQPVNTIGLSSSYLEQLFKSKNLKQYFNGGVEYNWLLSIKDLKKFDFGIYYDVDIINNYVDYKLAFNVR